MCLFFYRLAGVLASFQVKVPGHCDHEHNHNDGQGDAWAFQKPDHRIAFRKMRQTLRCCRQINMPTNAEMSIGMPHSGAQSSYEPVILAALGQGMVGSKMGDVVIQRDIPWMIDLYEQGRLKLDELISGRWTLEQINEAIEDTKTGSAKRNVIVFDRG